VVVDDCSGTILFSFEDGRSQKVKLVGYGTPLKNHLERHFPEMQVEFIPGT
jgi:hypothetical protein